MSLAVWVWNGIASLRINEGKILEKILKELRRVFHGQNGHNSESWTTSGEVPMWRLLSRFTLMLAQFKMSFASKLIDSHKGRFKAKIYLSYAGIIRYLSLEPALVCMKFSFRVIIKNYVWIKFKMDWMNLTTPKGVVSSSKGSHKQLLMVVVYGALNSLMMRYLWLGVSFD